MTVLTKTWLAIALLLFSTLTIAAEIVNINKADAAAIQQNLTGIGPVKAEAIVRYRNKVGKFKSLEDLQNVDGLGPALVKKNKKLLSLSKGVTKGDAKAYSSAKKKATAASKTTAKSTKKSSSSSKSKDSGKSKTAAKSKSSASTSTASKSGGSNNVSSKTSGSKKSSGSKTTTKKSKKSKSKSKTKKKKTVSDT